MSARRPVWAWLAGVSWDAIPGTEHRLVTELAADVDVVWVDPARSVLRSPSVRLRHQQPVRGIHRVTVPAPPAPYRRPVAPVTRRWANRALRTALGQLDLRPDVIVGTSPHPDLAALGPGPVRLFYATDDFAAGAHLMGVEAAGFARDEARRVREADGLAAVSPALVARWPVDDRPRLVLPNGCDPAAFADVEEAPWPAQVRLAPPMAVLVGQLSSRIDPSLLEAVLGLDIPVLLVGPVLDDFPAPRLLDHPLVQSVGAQPFEALPSFLRAGTVGLVPYADDAFNRASFPLKILEYLSAGRAVVSTPLPAVGRLDTPLVRTAADPSGFARETASALAEEELPGGDLRRSARQAFAATHSWRSRAEDLLGLADQALSARAR